jgi:membrane protein implicated in regulation of membrane protease activity
MNGILLVGGNWPLYGGSSEWNWWALVGFAVLVALLLTARTRLPLFLLLALAAVGGLVLSDLTDALGVMPVWSSVLLVALSRGLLRKRRRPQV